MKNITVLAVVAATLAVLSIDISRAQADVGISIGIPLPGVTFYAPPPPVYYSAPAYYPRYYAPPAYYSYGYGYPAYGTVYFGGHRHGGWGGRHGYHGGYRGHGRGRH